MSTVKLGFIGTGGNAGRHMRDLSGLEGTELIAFSNFLNQTRPTLIFRDTPIRPMTRYSRMLQP